MKEGRPDLTICSQSVFKFFKSWEVLPTVYGDHRPIVTEFSYTFDLLPKRRFKTNVPHTRFKYNVSRLQAPDFMEARTENDFDLMYSSFYSNLIEQAKKSFRLKSSIQNKKFSWWVPELAAQRNKVTALFKKACKPGSSPHINALYKRERALYRKSILEAKRKSWTSFCQKQTDPFGPAKKIAFDKYLDKQVVYLPSPDQSTSQAQPVSRSSTFFKLTEDIFGKSAVPEISVGDGPYLEDPIQTEIPFTMKEVRNAIYSFNKKKAPGPDNIDHLILRSVFETIPETILNMFNSCLNLNYFPSAWKLGELVFFRKEHKPENIPSSFRPITLLPVFGKVYEKLLLRRIQHDLHHLGTLTGKQHGFVELHSTESAMQYALSLIDLNKNNDLYTSLISLDFRGAFDNLPWDRARFFLKKLGLSDQLINILLSFLRNRRALVDWLFPELIYYFYKGCPQGSVLGPFLWLALLELLLSSFSLEGCEIVSYADDVLLIIGGGSRALLEHRGSSAVAFVLNWALNNNLIISQEKSLAITFGKPSHPKLHRPPVFKFGNVNIKSTKLLKYLGVLLDENLTFLPHLQEKRKEIAKVTQNLYKFSARSGGLPPNFLKIWYNSILQRRLAYSCSIWYPRMWRSHGSRLLLSAQRKALLLISGAYANTSTEALQILLGIPPLDLQLEAESTLTRVVRLGVSVSPFSAMDYVHKTSQYLSPRVPVDPVMNLASEFQGNTIIYTDGSKHDNTTGAAYCVFRNDELFSTWQGQLRQHNSVFQAEGLAILRAVQWAASDSGTQFLIRTDSLSTLLALSKPKITNLIHSEILSILSTTSKFISFNWVRGHSGVEGNELADRLAKSAAEDAAVSLSFLPIPSSHLKLTLKKRYMHLWQLRWNASLVGRYTYQFIPKIHLDHLIQDRYLIFFFTNHGPFAEHLYIIGKTDSPLCVCGGLGSSVHYILECCLTRAYHVKKHSQMSLSSWFDYLLEKPFLLDRISKCVQHICSNELYYLNPLPYRP